MTENIEKDVVKALELALKFADEPIGENWMCSITTKAAKEILNLIKNKNTELKELKAEIERYEKTVGKLVTNDDGTAFATLDGKKTEYIQKKVATTLKNIAVKKAKSEARKEFVRKFIADLSHMITYDKDYIKAKANKLLEEMERE